MNRAVISILIIGILFGLTSQSISQNALNPDIDIKDTRVENLDGAYSVISILDNGETQQFNVKFNKGVIISIVIDGNELDKSDWKDNSDLIYDYLAYIVPDKQKSYKYQEIYDLETELKKDIKKLERNIQELELSRRLEEFYDEEMKEWIKELEEELEDSEVLKEIEVILEDVMKELNRFLQERKEYQKEK